MYSLSLLEYDKALELVKDYCISDYSKIRLLSTKPMFSKPSIEKIFNELKELLLIIHNGLNIDLQKINDTTGLVEKALKKNNYLELAEISLIRDNILSFILLKRKLSALSAGIPLLAQKISKTRTPHGLKEKIDKVIDVYSNIKEDATPRLFEIMRKARETRYDIEKILESYINSPETKKFLQEKHITLKDDRYVIPIKHNFKGRIPGIIHAQSGSGETLFLEPFSITSKNNELRLLQKEREKELRRILISLTSEIGKCHSELNLIQETLSDIDILLAKCAFMKDYQCTIPEFSDKREILLKGARHPLLKEKAVPIDFSAEHSFNGVVITGPNTGGKTVSLKTIGLSALLAQSGFPVPARMMKSFIFESIFADIGDEQSIEQSLSTFSGHIKNIKKIVNEAQETSLVLIDELGAGTDPVEGGAIGTAILDYLIKRNILVISTTHFSIIKMYALNSEKVRVASVQFDPDSCKPTYKLIMGIPGRSNALEIAQHLGLKKKILDSTVTYLSEKEKSIDNIFKNLGMMEIRLSRKEQKIDQEEERLCDLTERYQIKLNELQEKERFIRAGYKKELGALLSNYSRKLEKSISEIKEKGASKESIKAAKEEKAHIENDFAEYEKSRSINEDTDGRAEPRALKIGALVFVTADYGSKIKGQITEIKDGHVTVQAGILRFTVEADNVTLDSSQKDPAGIKWDYELSEIHSKSNECNIRGKRYDEAMEVLEKFLDNAVLANINTVSIIHGLGTGALRQGVWEVLRSNKWVDHYGYAHPEQGGFGCTIVKLKT